MVQRARGGECGERAGLMEGGGGEGENKFGLRQSSKKNLWRRKGGGGAVFGNDLDSKSAQ